MSAPRRHKSGVESSKGTQRKGSIDVQKSDVENSKGSKGNEQHQYPVCKGSGHRCQNSKEVDPESLEAYADVPKKIMVIGLSLRSFSCDK